MAEEPVDGHLTNVWLSEKKTDFVKVVQFCEDLLAVNAQLRNLLESSQKEVGELKDKVKCYEELLSQSSNVDILNSHVTQVQFRSTSYDGSSNSASEEVQPEDITAAEESNNCFQNFDGSSDKSEEHVPVVSGSASANPDNETSEQCTATSSADFSATIRRNGSAADVRLASKTLAVYNNHRSVDENIPVVVATASASNVAAVIDLGSDEGFTFNFAARQQHFAIMKEKHPCLVKTDCKPQSSNSTKQQQQNVQSEAIESYSKA